MTAPDAQRLADVRRVKMAATQRLLGDTIMITETDWSAPTPLPGWTRAHVAAHLARNADALRGCVASIAAGTAPVIEPDDLPRDLEIGSRRSPLDVQIDLDTSAGLLNSAFSQLTPSQWAAPVGSTGMIAADLPLARLNEIVIHHVDLDCGFGFVDVDKEAATWLLAWNVARRTDLAEGPMIRVRASSGWNGTLGNRPGTTVVSGTDANLLGWITGRLPRTAVVGADHVSVGPLR